MPSCSFSSKALAVSVLCAILVAQGGLVDAASTPLHAGLRAGSRHKVLAKRSWPDLDLDLDSFFPSFEHSPHARSDGPSDGTTKWQTSSTSFSSSSHWSSDGGYSGEVSSEKHTASSDDPKGKTQKTHKTFGNATKADGPDCPDGKQDSGSSTLSDGGSTAKSQDSSSDDAHDSKGQAAGSSSSDGSVARPHKSGSKDTGVENRLMERDDAQGQAKSSPIDQLASLLSRPVGQSQDGGSGSSSASNHGKMITHSSGTSTSSSTSSNSQSSSSYSESTQTYSEDEYCSIASQQELYAPFESFGRAACTGSGGSGTKSTMIPGFSLARPVDAGKCNAKFPFHSNGVQTDDGKNPTFLKPFDGKLDEVHQLALDLHNQERQRYGYADLVWNTELADFAACWADLKGYGHSRLRFIGAGENIGEGYGQSCYDSPKDAVSSVVKGFLDEDRRFAEDRSIQADTGHWTQCVWKNTQALGCAVSKRAGLMDADQQSYYVVCSYYPAGNVVSRVEMERNLPNAVTPPRADRSKCSASIVHSK